MHFRPIKKMSNEEKIKYRITCYEEGYPTCESRYDSEEEFIEVAQLENRQ